MQPAANPPLEFHPRFEVLVSDVGAPKQGLMNIGEGAKRHFAVLPDPLMDQRGWKRGGKNPFLLGY